MHEKGTPCAALSADCLRRQLAGAGTASLRIRGDSMRPVLPAGARLRLRAITRRDTLRGAIVAVDAGEQVIVHRVVGQTPARVTTRGIASARLDPAWPRDRLIGVVAARRGARGLYLGERCLRWAAALAALAYRARQAAQSAWPAQLQPRLS